MDRGNSYKLDNGEWKSRTADGEQYQSVNQYLSHGGLGRIIGVHKAELRVRVELLVGTVKARRSHLGRLRDGRRRVVQLKE